MGYTLRPGLAACIANGRTAFLDTRADRYFCLPPAMDARFQAILRASPLRLSEDDLGALVKQGVLLASDTMALRSAITRYPSPDREAPLLRDRHLNLLAMAEAAIDRSVAIRDIQRQSLEHVLDTCRIKVERAQTRALPPIEGRLRSDLYAFQMSARLVTSFNQCLSSSIALTRFLSRRDHYPHLILGVRMAPFAAHAWVQSEDLVLNDTVDMASRYTPILVI